MEHMTSNPDGPTVFAALRNRGMKIAVVTNTPAALARAILKEATLSPQVLVGGTDVPHAKPAPDMVIHACHLLGVDPKEALVVGDTKNDADAARAAGVAFAGLRLGGGHTLKILRDVLSVARGGKKP